MSRDAYCDRLTEIAKHIDGWKVTLEFPGYLSHTQEFGLEIRMGYDLLEGNTFEGQYFRDGEPSEDEPGWVIENPSADVGELGKQITHMLNTANLDRVGP